MYIAGHRMETMIGVLMLTGSLGYGLALCSYNKEMVFALIGETRLMPDLDNMAAAVKGSFQELLAEARKINAPPSDPVRIEPTRAKPSAAGSGETTEEKSSNERKAG
jgi:hypothetical protein